MDARTKELLNKFSESQPALVDLNQRGSEGKNAKDAQIQLGDLIEEYVAGEAADWAGEAPKTVGEAIDRIASALAAEIAAPIG